MIKLGLDLHGVITSNPIFFSQLSQTLVAAGHEVHIITGKEKNDALLKRLEREGIVFTHFFSIADCLKGKGVPVRYEDAQNPWFDKELWNKAKAEYCNANNIFLIDDSPEYLEYCDTPCALFMPCGDKSDRKDTACDCSSLASRHDGIVYAIIHTMNWEDNTGGYQVYLCRKCGEVWVNDYRISKQQMLECWQNFGKDAANVPGRTTSLYAYLDRP